MTTTTTTHDIRDRRDRRSPYPGQHREQHVRVGPHVAEVERRIAALAEHYQRLGGWHALGRVPGTRPTGGTQ